MKPTGWRRWVLLLLALAMVAAACSGDDDGATDETPEADGGTDDADGSDGAADGSDGADGQAGGGALVGTAAIDLGPVDATGEALFPCAGTSGLGEVRIAYAEIVAVDAQPVLGDRFLAAIADYQRRCGGVAAGSLTATVAVADAGDEASLCDAPGLDDALVVVANTADAALADCLGSDRLLWIEDGAPEDSPQLIAGTEAPVSVTAGAAIAMAADEGAIGERPIVIIHDGSERALAGAAGAAASAETAGADVLDTLEADCDGTDIGRDLDGTMLVTLLPPACLSDLAAEIGAAGAAVRWLVIEDALSLAADLDIADPSTLDGALSYEFAPTIPLGLPREMAPVARDRACNAFLDGLTGQETVWPSAAFTAGARLCATVGGVLGAIQAAGDEPTPAAIVAALGELDAAPLPFGQTGDGSGSPWLAPAQAITLEWNADCTCWTYVRGPDVVPG